ncbi:EamA family transporter [Ureibacillus acetophenoni]|uniref:Threonine/homoserine efflux transporter RhtA n=1 Tax=Ureibacillus acetophenoni TaxID=614649 RepID=A0A285UKM0_9BACL|nr:DMT family transporter [Ureibacillus acetophenoni]SOC42445.1 threonine/homoserine efflux transporter RhtA [Ureibacillus acetophenoni]
MKYNILYPLLIIIASSSYGILSTIVKVAMNHGYTSAEATTSQYAIGFLLALILFLITQKKLPRISKSGFLFIVFAGICTGTTGIVYNQSLNYLPASLAVVLLFQFTWIGMLIDCLLRKRLPSRAEAISLVFLFLGTILAAGLVDVDLSNIAWQGWVFGLASAVSFSIFIQFNSRPVEGITTISRTLLMSFVALLMISVFSSPEVIWNGKLFGSSLFIFGVILGIFGIILPIVLFSIAAPKVGGGLTSILSAMELPVAIMASVIVLHETLTLLQISGIVLVIIGMTLPTVLAQRKKSV